MYGNRLPNNLENRLRHITKATLRLLPTNNILLQMFPNCVQHISGGLPLTRSLPRTDGYDRKGKDDESRQREPLQDLNHHATSIFCKCSININVSPRQREEPPDPPLHLRLHRIILVTGTQHRITILNSPPQQISQTLAHRAPSRTLINLRSTITPFQLQQ